MKKLSYCLVLGLTLLSCTSTKIYPLITCNLCLAQSDGVILMPLAWEPSFRTLSTAQQNQLERMILENLRAEGFSKVEVLDRLDFEMLQAGIKDLNDPAQRAKIHSDLGYPYLLGLSLGEAEWAGEWEFENPQDPNSTSYWESDAVVGAMLRVALVASESGRIEADYSVQTTQSSMPIPIGEEETLDLNFGTIAQSISIATRKGLKFMVKDCGC